MAKNEDVPPSTREITDSASFGDNCCATAERKLFVDLDGTVAWNSGQKKKKKEKWENIGKEIITSTLCNKKINRGKNCKQILQCIKISAFNKF